MVAIRGPPLPVHDFLRFRWLIGTLSETLQAVPLAYTSPSAGINQNVRCQLDSSISRLRCLGGGSHLNCSIALAGSSGVRGRQQFVIRETVTDNFSVVLMLPLLFTLLAIGAYCPGQAAASSCRCNSSHGHSEMVQQQRKPAVL